MNFFEKIVSALQWRMPTPTPYGWFHLLVLAITIGLSIFFGIKMRKSSDKAIRRFLLIFSIVSLVLEVYKQLVFSYDASNDTWSYEWYSFPFQFCSSPIYVALIASFIKKESKFKDFLYSFLGTFSLLAGTLVLLMPNDIYISMGGVNIQTSFVHGGMIVMGVMLLASQKCKLEHKTILKSGAVFSVLVAIALLMNCVYVWCGGTETFNMFFISPYFPSTLPVFSIIYTSVPYIIFLLLYFVGFCLAAYIVLLIAMLCKFSYRKIKAKQNKTVAVTTNNIEIEVEPSQIETDTSQTEESSTQGQDDKEDDVSKEVQTESEEKQKTEDAETENVVEKKASTKKASTKKKATSEKISKKEPAKAGAKKSASNKTVSKKQPAKKTTQNSTAKKSTSSTTAKKSTTKKATAKKEIKNEEVDITSSTDIKNTKKTSKTSTKKTTAKKETTKKEN